MKAEKINLQFEAQKIHSQFGTTEMANYKIQKLCESYAKDQIKKDRERIKENATVKDFSFNVHKMKIVDKQSIDNTPIILD